MEALPETPRLAEDDESPGSDTYSQLLSSAFAEAQRVLAQSGILVVFYTFHTFSALELLADALSQADLEITAVWALQTEGRAVRTRLRPRSTTTPFPIVVVCRKRVSETQGSDYLWVRAHVRARVRELLQGCKDDSMADEHLFSRAVIPTFEIFSQNQPILKADGERVTLLDLLRDVQEEILDFILVQELMNEHL
jgi:adenine-specific DNA methylase